jgi:hypothetical protein
MKTIKILVIALVTASFVSCNDAIEIEQPGRLLAENAFQTVSDLNGGLLGAYDFLDTTYEIGFTASFTDEVYRGADNGGQNQAEQNFILNPNTGYVNSMWLSYYGAIGAANRVIEAAATVDGSGDLANYNNIIGQAYAIRAFSMFKIMAYFSPDIRDDNALAGPLVLTPAEDIFSNPDRVTNAEFIAQINADLQLAENLITLDQGNTFFNVDALNALRARIATYRGEYTTADDLAEDLLLSYPIANQTQYFNMYTDTDDTEVIFKLARVVNGTKDGQGIAGGGWAGSLFAFVDATASGGAFMEVSRSVFNILDGTNDIRLDRNVNLNESSIDPTYATNPNFVNSDVLLAFKYPGVAQQALLNDLKEFRSAEMLLIRAEAAAFNSAFGDVATYIKQLRDARYGTPQTLPTYTSQTEAYGAILDERRLEFLFEGHRYMDLKRLGDLGNRQIDRDAAECANLSGCTLSNNDFRFTMPIPNVEITGNPSIAQNPNY